MNAVETVAVFAKALDAEDFETAAAMLTPECEYASPDGTLIGPDAIVASYRSHAERARWRLDEVEYESVVEPAEDGTVRVLYVDRIRLGEHRHEYRCRQVLTVAPGRGIVRIAHEEIAGEAERVLAFYERCGLRSREA